MLETTVSVPSHLRSRLKDVSEILPEALSKRVDSGLLEHRSEISHSTLLDISKWARNDGRSRLNERALDPNQYTMIALLAGTTTSPSAKFPPYVPPMDPVLEAKRTSNDRQAITALMNALLSIGGAGYAAWWASGRTGWNDEWRVLFALMAAVVVAASEGILYLIWQSREQTADRRRVIPVARKAQKKQEDKQDETVTEKVSETTSNSLRKRQTRPPSK